VFAGFVRPDELELDYLFLDGSHVNRPTGATGPSFERMLGALPGTSTAMVRPPGSSDRATCWRT
jgi:hypothetical protein